MFVSSCRSFSFRNFSNISSSTSIINSNTIDIEWTINILSLIIFFLALFGNGAALIVMFGSRGPIRLTNNKYLVNLAFADLLRASFMPFTIIARMKKNFMFGPVICKILPIVQGLSVAVDVFTLVCISVERYIAICRPLLILKLQSLKFSNVLNGFILILIWSLAFLTALPNIFMYNLCSLPKSRTFKCEKVKPIYFDDRFYMLGILVFYFLTPMLIMLILYTLIICKIYKNNTAMKMRSFQNNYLTKTFSISSTSQGTHRSNDNNHQRSNHSDSLEKSRSTNNDDENNLISRIDSKPNSFNRQRSLIKSSNSRSNNHRTHSSTSNQSVYRMDRHRRKALKLLIVIILEFFICWTPLFLFHTLGTFNKKFYRIMPTIFVDIILLFSFASLLCNPFTYYFMSKRYRMVLYGYLSLCCFCRRKQRKLNKKTKDAQQFIEALRLHQQQNSFEYQPKCSSQQFLKNRSNTLY